MTTKTGILGTLTSIPKFWHVQQKDWKVTVIRTSLERLGYQIVYPYLSLYIVALGAQKAHLGLLTCLGMVLSALIGPNIGQFIDHNGAKKVYSFGIVLLLTSYLLYAFSPNWYWCILAMIIYYVGSGTSTQSCGTICGNCLKNCDRAKGMLICESLAAGLLGMIGPMIAAFILVQVLGVTETAAGVNDYRVLFFASAFFTLISLIVVLTQLSNQRWAVRNKSGASAMREGMELLKTNKNARKWIAISAVANLPTALVLPYVQVYAGEVKMASVTVLAVMVTASALTSVVCGYPIGALADRLGRKKILYVVIPLYWLSNLLLIWAPSPAVLIAAGILQGFSYITQPLTGAVQRELVSQDVMGVWIGFNRLTTNLISAAAALVSGFIYDYIGPAWVFLFFIALDAIIRMPLLISLPETLNKESGT